MQGSGPRRRPSVAGRLRIVGGEWRSRIVTFPDRPGLRPTPDRVRETLFNWLGQRLDGKRCLDLFAGSGALGFEAGSRGARSVTMVESDRVAAASLRENVRALGAAGVEVVEGDAIAVLSALHDHYDVVFVDPPYSSALLDVALGHLAARLAPGGLVYAESARGKAAATGWEVWREGAAGQVVFRLLRAPPAVPSEHPGT